MPVEWVKARRVVNQGEFDGLVVSRTFNEASSKGDFLVKLSFFLENSPKKFVLSPQLSSILGIEEETRAKVISGLWQYIKTNRLQDPEDRRFINLNTELQKCFGEHLERI